MLTSAFRTGLALCFFVLTPWSSNAQTMAGINAQMSSFNQRLAQNQIRINEMVVQKMRDPKVKEAYQRYLHRSKGRAGRLSPIKSLPTTILPPMASPAQVRPLYRQNEQRNQVKVAQAYADEQGAEKARGRAQIAGQEHFNANQQETGRLLRGTSTYEAPNGQKLVLPHTWQANSTHSYEGQTIRVDASGHYAVLGVDQQWYPLQR